MTTTEKRLSDWAAELSSRWIRPAIRGVLRSPLASFTVIVTLAGCIGVSSAVLSVADHVFLKPLPYPQADQLALVTAITGEGSEQKTRTAQNGTTWEALSQGQTGLQMAVYSPWTQGVNLVAGEIPSFVKQQRVSRGFFATLGVAPALGRAFTEEEDRKGGPSVVILSHSLWQRVFESDRHALGQSITLKGEPHTVIGIMPVGFRGFMETDVWTPLKPAAGAEGGGSNYEVLVRIPDSISSAEASDRIFRVGQSIDIEPGSDARAQLGLVSLSEGLTEQARRPLQILTAAALLVLMIGCLKVATLLLVQVRQREAEVGTRLALGAGRIDIIRSLLAEQTLIALISGCLGAAVGAAALGYFQRTQQGPAMLLENLQVDGRFVVVAFGLSVLSLTLIVLGPALRVGRQDLRSTFADRARGITSRRAADWTRRWIVIGEVALAFALLISAGLLLRSLNHLSSLEPGCDPSRVHVATVSMQETRYLDSQKVNQVYTQSLDALVSDPGIESAAVALGVPFERWLNLDVRRLDRPDKRELSDLIYITPSYFKVLNIPLVQGRELTEADNQDTLPVVIVSQAFVKKYFPEENPVGTTIEVSGTERQIVGIVGDVQRVPGWGGSAPLASMPAAFVPAQQLSDGFFQVVHGWFSPVWVVKTRTNDPNVVPIIRSAIASVDPLLPVGDTRSLEDASMRALAWPRFQTTLAGTFAILAILLTAVGLYGLLSQSVLERRQELGIRLALGSSRQAAILHILRPEVLSLAAGVGLGFFLSQISHQWLKHVLWGVQPNDSVTVIGVTGIFMVIGVSAVLFSALRVVHLQPSTILRSQ